MTTDNTTKKKLTPKEAVAAAYAFVHPTVDALAEVQACEHAYANMGQDPEEYARRWGSQWSDRMLREFFKGAWYQLREEAGYDEGVGDIDDERQAWVKEAMKEAKMVAGAGLPLTLENTRKAFEGKPPFEKKKKATKKAKRR